MSDKKSRLFGLLSAIFITNALLAEIIGVKIFSLETLLGFAPAQLSFFPDLPLDFNLTSGVLLWPVVFVTSDVINEYFGKAGVKRISFMTAGLIAYSFVILLLVTQMPPAEFWLKVNNVDDQGQAFNIDYAFTTLFTQGLGIIMGSLTAFLIGQLLDVYVFHILRRVTGSKMIWLRATGSTLISQLIDSFVVLMVAFYIFGNWTIEMVIAVGIVNYIYKFFMALLLTPLLYVAHYLIDRYLGEEQAKSISDAAADKSRGFF